MKHPFLAALFITVLLFTGYFAWRSGSAMRPPETTTVTPTAPVSRVTPNIADKTVAELITTAQQQIDDGEYDQALATLAVAKQKEPTNQRVGKLILQATNAKQTEERINRRRQ